LPYIAGMADAAQDRFYADIPPFDRFEEVVDAARYRPLPTGWLVGVADVVDSTGAIAAGRYKAVNMAGASVISAVFNAIGRAPFPFVFGGDGAAFAVPGGAARAAADALAACRAWAGAETGLSLRGALVPVSDIRAAGHDVTVARFSASPSVAYAMFAGGGVHWAEAEMKAGRFEIPTAPAGAQPDLSGLSCRWTPIEAQAGEIVSVLVAPAPGADAAAFAALVTRVLDIVGGGSRDGHPVPAEGARFSWPPRGFGMELSTLPGARRLRHACKIVAEQALAWLLDAAGTRLKTLDPARYRAETALNTDFRKFDDGLKLTVDCAAEVTARLEAALEEAREGGVAHYGLHRQLSALMTCIVPSPFTPDHMHFVDGAAGGYARAAEMLKAQLSAAADTG
jgi:hypothetical protein